MTAASPRRRDQRAADALRPIEITIGAVPYAEGSALIKQGDTHVLCAATVDESVPVLKYLPVPLF